MVVSDSPSYQYFYLISFFLSNNLALIFLLKERIDMPLSITTRFSFGFLFLIQANAYQIFLS